MRVATSAYPLTECATWYDYFAKQKAWVNEAVAEGAELLVFPEYGSMELATLDGLDAAGDLEGSLHAANGWAAKADEVMAELAVLHGIHILGASGPVFDGQDRPVNRARLFGPSGPLGFQDKQVMTRFERDTWNVVSGGALQVFDIGQTKLGILICYDSEFPLLGRYLIEAGVEILLVPSCTETLSGYWRVRIGAMARALEGQCVVLHSPTVGPALWNPAVSGNTGAAAVYGPPDLGFPDTGVIAEGELNQPGWVFADIDLEAIRRVRREGRVLNVAHWPESHNRS